MVQLGKYCIIGTAHVHGPGRRLLISCEGVCVNGPPVCALHYCNGTCTVHCPAGLALHNCNGVYHQSELFVYAGHS
jgi:hypothetical protein